MYTSAKDVTIIPYYTVAVNGTLATPASAKTGERRFHPAVNGLLAIFGAIHGGAWVSQINCRS